MNLIAEGILYGLFLASLTGPLFILLTRTGMHYGLRAGLSVGTGIWASDFGVIAFSWLVYKGVISREIGQETNMLLGISGGFLLIAFGIYLFRKKHVLIDHIDLKFSKKNFPGFWLKGFLVNTVNPFTFIFWMGLISANMIKRSLNDSDMYILVCTVMIVIIISDSMKVWFAKLISKKMKEKHYTLVNRLAGAGLVFFGIYLIIRSIVEFW
jgi:threonine/homoserine/homoserine lactone efflux protein